MAHSDWRSVYRAGAAAALVAVIVFRRNFSAELTVSRGFGIFSVPETMPGRAEEWFVLLQNNRVVGLILFNVVDLINYALVGLILLALYGALRQAGEGVMMVAIASGMAGIAVYFASNQAFAMLSLSERYAAATTDALRSTFVAAGEALLAIHDPGAIFPGMGPYMSLFLVSLAGLIISVVMLRSDIFGTATAVVGILANGLALAYLAAIPLAPPLRVVPIVTSAPFRILWYVLIARELFRQARVA